MVNGSLIDGFRSRFGKGYRLAARSWLIATMLIAVAPALAEAQAGSRLCRQLEARLAATSTGGRALPAQARSYDDAIARQQQQMTKVRAQTRQAGCRFAFSGRAVAHCGELNKTLARMEANLGQLQKNRARLGASNDDRRERARIMAALNANDCRAPQRRPSPAEAGDTTKPVRQTLRPGPSSGNFRTLCVRSCDGYYFPVSWSVSQAAFARDSVACQAMCPGTEVELHYHRVTGEEPQDMVSASTGLPYRDSKTAFLYRQPGASIPTGCGCEATKQATQGFETIGGEYDSNNPGADADNDALTASIPQPHRRPDPAEDPETLATREGGLDAEALRQLAAPSSAVTLPAAQSRIRVVGPMFFPDR